MRDVKELRAMSRDTQLHAAQPGSAAVLIVRGAQQLQVLATWNTCRWDCLQVWSASRGFVLVLGGWINAACMFMLCLV